MGSAEGASPFGLGCVSLGSIGSRKGVRLVHQALDLGVRYVDTADAYGAGASERVIGRALRRRRDAAFVATKSGYSFRERSAFEHAVGRMARSVTQRAGKLGRPASAPARLIAGSRRYASQDFSVHYLRGALDASLRRLDMDHVDLYQLHDPGGVCDDEVLGLMVDLRSEGKIRGFGVGLEVAEQAMAWLGTGALSSVLIPFGVLDPEAGDQVIPLASAQGVPVVVRGVFAGGFLAEPGDGDDGLLRAGQPQVRRAVRALASVAGVNPLQVAAWFVTTNSGVTTVLVGTSSLEHLEQSLRYVETRPPDDILPLLHELVRTDGATGATDLSPGDGAA